MIGYNDLMSMIGKLNVEHQARIVIEINDPKNIFEFAKNVEGAPIDELAKAIIKIQNPEYIYKFARYIKGAPIDELTTAILKIKNFKYICKFARLVKGVPIDKITKFIIATNDARTIYSFARYIGKKKQIDKLATAIIATKNSEYIVWFAQTVKGAPVEKLAKVIIETDHNSGIYFSEFIRLVKDAPIDTMVNIVIRKNYVELISRLLYNKEIRDKYFDRIIKALIKNNAADEIAQAAEKDIEFCDVYGFDKKYINDCCNAIIKTGNAKFIYSFAESINYGLNKCLKNNCLEKQDIEEYTRYIKEDLTDKLADAIIATQDATYIKEFLLYVDGAPIDKLFDGLIKTNNIEIIVSCYSSLINKTPSSEREIVNNKIITVDNCMILFESIKKEMTRLKKILDDLETEKMKNYDTTIIFYANSVIQLNELVNAKVDELLKWVKRAIRTNKIATKSIRKPKINATQEQPKRYVRTKR